MESNTPLEAQYDNRALVPEHVEILPRWETDAASYRDSNGAVTYSYGPGERQKYDVMRAADGAGQEKTLIVFIHGGYWRSLDRSLFSHMAKGLNHLGFDVAMPSYSLCPDVSIPDICSELESFIAHLADTHQKPLMITGHSAGGHLAAWLCQEGLAERLGAEVKAGLGISGVYNLDPLREISINADLRLDADQARQASPILHAPDPAIHFDAWVGANESPAFLSQSEHLAGSWESQGGRTTYIEMAGANHFTAIEPLTDPKSLLCQRIASLAG
jgi:arylformamidase